MKNSKVESKENENKPAENPGTTAPTTGNKELKEVKNPKKPLYKYDS
jgi:hypothetical protein